MLTCTFGPLNDPSARANLRNQFGPIVESGIADLNRALAIDSAYTDAMAYLNLLYRERADYSESKEDYQRDIATANDYVSKALAARGQQAQQSPAQGQQTSHPFPLRLPLRAIPICSALIAVPLRK